MRHGTPRCGTDNPLDRIDAQLNRIERLLGRIETLAILSLVAVLAILVRVYWP